MLEIEGMGTTEQLPVNGFQTARRVQLSLLAGVEKRVLVWMAQRMPQRINSDHLSLLGLLSMAGAGVFYWLAGASQGWLWAVNAMILLNWVGDSLDGTLARVRNQQRPRYGFYVDHIADTFGALALMAGLACSGYVHWQIAAGMLTCFMCFRLKAT